jgi:hypothetical protein
LAWYWDVDWRRGKIDTSSPRAQPPAAVEPLKGVAEKILFDAMYKK